MKGRKTKVVKTPPGQQFSRDHEKHFLITEWYADTAENWAFRMLLAYNRGGGEIDVGSMMGMGMEAVAVLGINTFLRGQIQASEITPILDELLDCVQMIRDPKSRDLVTGLPVATPLGVTREDIGEVATRLWLRSEVFRLHTGFSPADALLNLISGIMARSALPNT